MPKKHDPNGYVSQYDVGPGGTLSLTDALPAADTRPDGIAVSPDGQSVYVTNLVSATVSQYDVGTGGLLSPLSPPTVAAGLHPFAVAVSPR